MTSSGLPFPFLYATFSTPLYLRIRTAEGGPLMLESYVDDLLDHLRQHVADSYLKRT